MRLKIYFSYAKMKNWKVCEKEKKVCSEKLEIKTFKKQSGWGWVLEMHPVEWKKIKKFKKYIFLKVTIHSFLARFFITIVLFIFISFKLIATVCWSATLRDDFIVWTLSLKGCFEGPQHRLISNPHLKMPSQHLS